MAIFPNFLFLGNIDQENVFYHILEQKNAFLGYKNQKLKKSKNWDFSKGVNPWFCSENGHFSNVLFLGNIGQENVVYDILERTKAFLGYKKRSSKIRITGIFPKGVTHAFGPKMAIFPTFFFTQLHQENVFYDILERNNAFLAYKNQKFKKS